MKIIVVKMEFYNMDTSTRPGGMLQLEEDTGLNPTWV
jgi:hypothetical protein